MRVDKSRPGLNTCDGLFFLYESQPFVDHFWPGGTMGRIFEFIANSTDGVFAVDRRQAIVLWNQGANRILGFSSGEILGASCYEILRGLDTEWCAVCRRDCDAITSARRLELTPTTDIAARTKQGSEVWLNLSTVVAPSRRQELSVLIHLFRDVTRQYELLRAGREFADVVSGQAAELPREARKPSATLGPCIDLTLREREILRHLMTGSSTHAIAGRLSISTRTVRNHVNNVLAKLGVHSRLEAVTYSIQNGLIDP